MNLINKWLLTGLLVLSLASGAWSREMIGLPQRKDLSNRVDASNCSPASTSIDLNVNNVRARIMNGGDMWWDLVGTAKYEVPKGKIPVANSLFAGAIWIGGIDQNNQLKVAAQTYRQTGNDYFPGPLDGVGGTTTSDVCNDFDKMWQVFGSEITDVKNLWNEVNPDGGSNPIPIDQIASNILQWPAKGNPNNAVVGLRQLAPFYDRDGDGLYDPTQGDYPIIGQHSSNVFADQMVFWVYNDNGNIHSETGGEPIGMEVQALAFAFQTSDEVNEMTFYKYKLINKSSTTLNNCYMGQWVDPDLGNFSDDYIGCDTVAGLGIVYNADPIDEAGGGGGSYGNQPPLVGIDYFQGPLDENGNELGMSNFLYFNNDFTTTGNPENTSDFYGYLSGKWKDGTPFTKGGTAYGGSVPTHYVFPSSPKDPDGWSECAEQNNPADRRIVQSSGPFKLLPGASNDIIVGVVWVQPPVGTYSPCPDFSLLLRADDRAQALFDNNFKILDGPAAPSLRIIEENRKLILAIEDYKVTESYVQADPLLVSQNIPDSLYRFEGYQIYQLKDNSVSLQQLGDPTKAQLVAEVDKKNGVKKLINFIYDANLVSDVPELKVDGEDNGIRHTFEITTNAFATGTDKNLINHQTYYFAVLPYAYNLYSKTDTTGQLYNNTYDSLGNIVSSEIVYQTTTSNQKVPYLSSRAVRVVTGIPHITQPEFGGLIQNAEYGDGPEITRQEGKGNGGLHVELTEASTNEILLNSFMPTPTYKGGQGPVKIKVYDPKNVPAADYELTLIGVDDNTGAFIDIPDSVVDVDNVASTAYDNDTILKRGIGYFITASQDTINDTVVTHADTTITSVVTTIYDTLITTIGDTIILTITPVDTTIYTTVITGIDTVIINPVTVTVYDTISTYHSKWVLRQMNGDTIVSETSIGEGNEQLIPDWGLSVYIEQVTNPQHYNSDQSVIDWSVNFEKPDLTWLSGVPDADPDPIRNWIWSGTFKNSTPSPNGLNDQSDWGNGGTTNPLYDDPTQQYEQLFGGTVAPYRLASNNVKFGPAWRAPSDLVAHQRNRLMDLPSIDLVLTSDTTKWTRCIVLEAGPDATQNEGGRNKMTIRAGRSKNRNGSYVSNDPSETGQSWFPGYAIEPETGKRLNICFGEDSRLLGQNGRDMIWNPTSEMMTDNGEYLLGGRHYLYVLKSQYDSCEFIKSLLAPFTTNTISQPIGTQVFSTFAWTSIPLLANGFEMLPVTDGLIPTTTTLKIRIKRAYQRMEAGPVENYTRPRYTFSTDGLATVKEDLAIAKSMLDTIKVVPNPYYGYAENYEKTSVDNRVKITNLPQKCVISIFSLDGTLIRRFDRDDPTVTSLEWDLKNNAGVPIASGIYIVHINAEGLGEKTLKWFGVMRPIDLDSF